MPHSPFHQSHIGHKKRSKQKRGEVGDPPETSAELAAGHSQDADRHHKVSHERLAKERGDFEHS